MTTGAQARRGGDWLIGETAPDQIFTPEKLSDEHRLIAQTAAEFVDQEVLPALDDLERKDWTLARTLIKRSGDLGLLGTDVPERFGGVGLDKASAIVVGEAIGAGSSFATTFGAQTGLAIIPILCFGTEAQQTRYLPGIVSGEIVGAYCLSESGSGSDALSARARATRQADGSWVLDGEKMWVTNGGFADLFIVFAKVDGERFSAFLVERSFPGVSSGQEEHKMGLLGSSTTPLLLQDARVPAGNLLGEVGKGHKIAFNVLNYGRFKLAAMCTGGARSVIAEAAAYASTRRQFGQPIASFGAIRHKLAEMTIRQFVVESMLYRTTGLIDTAIDQGGHDPAAALAALEEFAVEASLLKVASSEMIDYVIDENVQIHGGNGFVRDYPAERHYRDARVNRIFEGTNEINRLLVPAMLIKRALKGGVPILQAAQQVQGEMLAAAAPSSLSGPLAAERQAIAGLKKTALLVLGLAVRTYGEALDREQEVLMLASDILMDTFGAESAALRAIANPGAPLQQDAAMAFAHDAVARAAAGARTAFAAMITGDALGAAVAALDRWLAVAAADTVAARRRIADRVILTKQYIFASRG
jgi:alkylation response protein AidB-like acyl-CoA dehydrogenase